MGRFVACCSPPFCDQIPWLQPPVIRNRRTSSSHTYSRFVGKSKLTVARLGRVSNDVGGSTSVSSSSSVGVTKRLEFLKNDSPGILLALLVVIFSYPSLALADGPSSNGYQAQDEKLAFEFSDSKARGTPRGSLLYPVKLPRAITPAVTSSTRATSKGVLKVKVVPVVHPAVSNSGLRFLTRIVQHFGGGGIAGAIGAAVVYPLDTIKTRMQAQQKNEEYKNEIDCFRKVVTDEGIGSLYSGLIPQLVGIAPEKALKLTVNEVLLELLEQVLPGTGIWFLELIAGSGGGFSQVVFTNPMEILKVRLQTQSRGSERKRLHEVIKELGLVGLYHGAGATLARDIPSNGIFFACYAILKQLYPDQSFADSFLAAIPATVLSNPMDVVKTRLQMERSDGEPAQENAWSCMRSVWIKEGPNGLLKGSLARVMRTSPQFGITFLVYNFLCSL